MAQVNKIDSNATGLAYSEETSLGVVGATWYQLDPNSYSDWGGEVTKVSPNPINADRQRLKGVTTDLDASGGINHNLTFSNLSHLMQGFMFADFREAGEEVVTAVDEDTTNPDEYEVASTTGFVVNNLIIGRNFTNSANNALNVVTVIDPNVAVEVADGQLVAEASPPAGADIKVVGYQGTAGDIDVDVAGDFATLTTTTLDWTTLGLIPGQWIYIGGDNAAEAFTNTENNGFKRIRSIAANALVLDKSESTMVTEASTTETIHIYYGTVLKNETGSNIVRRTYHIERLLGAPDDASPAQIQTEYLVGAIPSEVVFNIPQAELANVDLSFVALDNLTRTGVQGPLQSSVQTFDISDEYNTSSDVARINISAVSATDEAPTPLFVYVTELTLTVNNNVSPNKAVGVLGAFEASVGTFAVSGSLTAYFNNVSSIAAVRNNTDATMDVIFAKDNQGIVLDMPLISLGDARLDVEIDQPIFIPLSNEAATGRKILSTYDHTLLINYFHYLPASAG